MGNWDGGSAANTLGSTDSNVFDGGFGNGSDGWSEDDDDAHAYENVFRSGGITSTPGCYANIGPDDPFQQDHAFAHAAPLDGKSPPPLPTLKPTAGAGAGAEAAMPTLVDEHEYENTGQKAKQLLLLKQQQEQQAAARAEAAMPTLVDEHDYENTGQKAKQQLLLKQQQEQQARRGGGNSRNLLLKQAKEQNGKAAGARGGGRDGRGGGGGGGGGKGGVRRGGGRGGTREAVFSVAAADGAGVQSKPDYKAELDILKSMGFDDLQKAHQLLIKFKGDVGSVVRRMI